MIARYVIACVMSAALLTGGGARSQAKPPDLPINMEVICQTEGEGPIPATKADGAVQLPRRRLPSALKTVRGQP